MRRALFISAIVCLSNVATATPHRVFKLEGGALPIAPLAPAAPGDKLQYYGGRVLSNTNVVSVAWGSNVDAQYMTKLEAFYKTILVSPYMDWFTEYDTIGLKGYADMMPGTNQHIGRGTFEKTLTITPSNASTQLADADIITELKAQLAANNLPAPKVDKDGNVNSLYMVDFPPGVQITLVGWKSCQQFGAYHGTFTYNNASVPYGVHPHCGYNFDTSTWIHSHELAESMTDMEVGLVEYNMSNPSARPLAWVTVANTAWASDESGDLCNGQTTKVAGYVVQKIWSNYAKACVAEIPICESPSADAGVVLMPPQCRPCNSFDSGNACGDPKPACATSGVEQGHCVKCTAAYPNACTGDTPVCDESVYDCVGCLKDSDCGAQDKPVCDAQSKKCRACAVDSECGARKCDTQSDTKMGQCVGCNTDPDCGDGSICVDHACAPKPAPEAGPPALVDAGTNPPPPQAAVGCSCNESSAASPAWFGLFALVLLRRRR